MGLFDAQAIVDDITNVTRNPVPSADAIATLQDPQRNGVPTQAPADTAGILHAVNLSAPRTLLILAVVGVVAWYAWKAAK